MSIFFSHTAGTSWQSTSNTRWTSRVQTSASSTIGVEDSASLDLSRTVQTVLDSTSVLQQIKLESLQATTIDSSTSLAIADVTSQRTAQAIIDSTSILNAISYPIIDLVVTIESSSSFATLHKEQSSAQLILDSSTEIPSISIKTSISPVIAASVDETINSSAYTETQLPLTSISILQQIILRDIQAVTIESSALISAPFDVSSSAQLILNEFNNVIANVTYQGAVQHIPIGTSVSEELELIRGVQQVSISSSSILNAVYLSPPNIDLALELLGESNEIVVQKTTQTVLDSVFSYLLMGAWFGSDRRLQEWATQATQTLGWSEIVGTAWFTIGWFHNWFGDKIVRRAKDDWAQSEPSAIDWSHSLGGGWFLIGWFYDWFGTGVIQPTKETWAKKPTSRGTWTGKSTTQHDWTGRALSQDSWTRQAPLTGSWDQPVEVGGWFVTAWFHGWLNSTGRAEWFKAPRTAQEWREH